MVNYMSEQSLSEWDKRLLKQHLSRYKKLECGEVRPSSPNEDHFVAVFKGNAAPKPNMKLLTLDTKQHF